MTPEARARQTIDALLTAAGRRLAKEGAKTLAQQTTALFGDLWTDKELETLARLLGRLTVNLPGTLNA